MVFLEHRSVGVVWVHASMARGPAWLKGVRMVLPIELSAILVGLVPMKRLWALHSLYASFVLALLLLGCGADEEEVITGPRVSGIAFVSDRDGNNEIYVMRSDGSELQNLTNHEASDTAPSWSPEGARIAFVSTREGSDQVYLMNADGTEVKKLTDMPYKKNMTSWSPDGKQIAFGVGEATYVVSVRGGDAEKLMDGMGPSWSPDGKMMALWRGQIPMIWLADPDGSNARALVSGRPSEVSPQDQAEYTFSLSPCVVA